MMKEDLQRGKRLHKYMKAGYWDIHNHILPGIDDGCYCMEETYRLLQSEYEQGIRNIIFTPHHRPDMFRVKVSEREMMYIDTLRIMQPKFPDMMFYLGCEYFTKDKVLEELKDTRFRMAGTRYILQEFSARDQYERMEGVVIDTIRCGYYPIIAHPERYLCLQNRPELVKRLKQQGALLQVNADSILGKEGKEQKQLCYRLLADDIVDFVSSDAHDPRNRPVRLMECMKKMEKKFGKEKVDWIFCEHPASIFSR